MKIIRFTALCAVAAMLLGTACEKEGGTGGVENAYAGLTFEVELSEPTCSGIEIHVTPSNDKAQYFVSVARRSDIDENFGGDVEACLKADLNNLRILVQQGYKWSDFLSSGESDFVNYRIGHLLFADTDYVLYIAGVSRGVQQTDAVVRTFRTAKAQPSDIEFEIVDHYGEITVKPSREDEPYFFDIVNKDAFEGVSSEEIVDFYVRRYGLNMASFLSFGEDYDDRSLVLERHRDYSVVVFGFDGAATTEVRFHDFRFDGPDRTRFTTLDADREFTGGATAYLEFHGQGYLAEQKSDANVWLLLVASSDGRESFTAQIFTPADQREDIAGTYLLDEWSYAAGTALRGEPSADPYNPTQGTWWCVTTMSGEMIEYAAAEAGGTIEIAKGEGTHVYSLDAVFECPNGHRVHVAYNGAFKYYDASGGSK